MDTDLLCLFAKRLVETHPTLRLIVMSATLSANLISEYYGLKSAPLFVGARRFPVRSEQNATLRRFCCSPNLGSSIVAVAFRVRCQTGVGMSTVCLWAWWGETGVGVGR